MRIAKPSWAVCLTLLLAACGTTGGPKTSDTTAPSVSSSSPQPVPAADKGPVCDGGKDAKGLHVLRGGTTALPGGGKVIYYEAGANGRHRTAVLSVDEAKQTVSAGRKITLKGRSYEVTQICTYRVVLTTPDHSGTSQGAHMAKWPTTHDGHWRLRWHVPDNGPAMGAVVTDIQGGPARASISVTAPGQGQLAFYDDVRSGSTVEIAGRLWKVAAIDTGHMNVEMNSPDFKAGYVDLQQLGDA
ncbi:hypothetical protein BFF78_18205 [Streptomyces fodineus]|uniref:Lipoprotein n=1 Tax=Streptomyces fodineus TaxID=1904616 RepID=A0A1D7YBM9_9ACTN|nr:hypothetical protein BFF78_18205 [Streptomyces fodineus]